MSAEPPIADADFILSKYEIVLRTAQQAGYAFAGFDEIGRETNDLTCLLRHDIDMELWHCDAISRIENELGIRATYFLMTRSTSYNLLCAESIRAVKSLLDRGHAIGLHFMGELCQDLPAADLATLAAEEVEVIRREFGCPVHAISFHQPSPRILQGDLELDGFVNTYNKRQMQDYKYVSDTNMHWQQEHPEEIFSRRLYPRLHLLIHPIWWTREPVATIDKWANVLEKNTRTVVRHWLDRERSLAGISEEELLSRVGSAKGCE